MKSVIRRSASKSAKKQSTSESMESKGSKGSKGSECERERENLIEGYREKRKEEQGRVLTLRLQRKLEFKQ